MKLLMFILMLPLAVTGRARTLETLSSFNGANGEYPQAALTLGADGSFYGTTQKGGDTNLNGGFGDGTVFQITTNGTLVTRAFFNGTNGDYPEAALAIGPDGCLYGTTAYGGNDGEGTIFKMTTNGTLTTLVSFTGTNGEIPYAGLTLGTDGNFYGTTAYGGYTNFNRGYGYGTVFKMTTNGTLTTLVSFTGTNGAGPQTTMTLDNDGNFYGTTADNDGTVFKVTTNGTLITLATFDGTNGEYPFALTLGTDGNFYGTTYGSGGSYIYGTVFKMTQIGTLTTLFAFNGTNGEYPNAALTLGTDGNFYGTTEGGSSGYGTVFKITTNGMMTTLASFNGTNGDYPEAALTLGEDGNFYDTTAYGYSGNDLGSVFRVVLPQVVNLTLSLQLVAGFPKLTLSGPLGTNYVIQYTTNFANLNWMNLLSLSNLPTSPYEFIDTAGNEQPARFYRVLMQ